MYNVQYLINPHQRYSNIILPAKSISGKLFFYQILVIPWKKLLQVLNKIKESDKRSSISLKFDGCENSGTTDIGSDFHTLIFSFYV